MAIVFKEIQPRKFDSFAFMAEFDHEAYRMANDMLLDFEATTATWKHQVKFERLIDIGKAQIAILVGTDDEIYGYVDKGTRPHVIRPKKKGGRLAFPSKFIPKTKPGHMVSSVGYTGGPKVVVPEVNHPGNKPRNFDKQIQKKWSPIFKKRMEAAMKRASKKSGYMI